MPPSDPKTKLGRKITNGSPELSNRLLRLPFRPVVRHEILRLLARAQGAHVYEAPDARLTRRAEEVVRALGHDPLELLVLALPDRDEVDDALDPVDRPSQARRQSVMSPSASSQPQMLERLPSSPVADEASHRRAGIAQPSRDMAADEPRSTGHENHRQSCT